ncbi:MAG: heat-inducible transcription repressor HrcA [Bacillota bacterium]|nr:heat-inducible transcription repressor HrcA [Bacillota bacterium]REJ38305.1 MAG: heat-inducible transcription repressor HrcA [Bacillota bacterium]
MDARKRQVLRAIVQDYVITAEPVGSRTVARRYGLGVSPATIRNEMADLEELGYLEQPHTSAGRIPSTKGYRFYVDELMDLEPPTAAEMERIRRLFAQQIREVDAVLRQAARILSEATDCLAVIQGPMFSQSIFRALQMILLRPGRALMVLVTDEGLVSHRLVEVPPETRAEDLERIAAVLTDRLAGMPIERVSRRAIGDLQVELAGYRALLDATLERLLTPDVDDERVLVDGTTNLFRQPEFREIERAHAVIRLLGEQQLVRDLLNGLDTGSGRVRVVIGEENPLAQMQEFSVVSATYTLDGREIGRLAVVGPTRMNYPRVVSMVDLVTQMVSDVLTRMLG